MAQITALPHTSPRTLNSNLFEISQLASLVSHIISLTSDALQNQSCYQLIDRITITRGYAELSLMHPNMLEYREQTSASLLKLADAVGSFGNSTLIPQLRSLADRCQKLAASGAAGG